MANGLVNASSPQLQQHADNPVGWWPWSPEALAEIALVGVESDLQRTAWRYAPAGSVVVAGEPDQPGIGLLEGRRQPGAYVSATSPAGARSQQLPNFARNSQADPDQDHLVRWPHDRCHRRHRPCSCRTHRRTAGRGCECGP